MTNSLVKSYWTNWRVDKKRWEQLEREDNSSQLFSLSDSWMFHSIGNLNVAKARSHILKYFVVQVITTIHVAICFADDWRPTRKSSLSLSLPLFSFRSIHNTIQMLKSLLKIQFSCCNLYPCIKWCSHLLAIFLPLPSQVTPTTSPATFTARTTTNNNNNNDNNNNNCYILWHRLTISSDSCIGDN